MPWHPFQPGEAYPADQIVVELRRRLPKIIDQPAKLREIVLFEQHRGVDLVWTPFLTRWGRLPYNQNAWKRVDGTAFIERAE